MLAENWNEVGRLFDQGLDLSAEERDTLLVECERETADAVRDLWKAHDSAGIFLQTPAVTIAERSRLTSGHVIAHRFRVLEPIGRGGMGEVYKAHDTRLNRTVAVKVLSEALAANPPFRARFEREARAVSSLNHPHICVLHDIGQEDGMTFLVMELLEGETLATRLEKGPLSVEQTLLYAAQIAQALNAAHRRGVLHRDLKPGNIFLTSAGAKLLDFGLAKIGTDAKRADVPTLTITHEGTLMGTPQYMAPEQLEGGESDARSDIFSFGAVLYEMLTARHAFEGKTAANVMAAILQVDPPAITALQPDAPTALERLVKVCLEKNPDDRWQTVRDLLRELQRISEPIPVQPSVLPRTRPNIGWLVAFLGFVLAAVLGFIDLRKTPLDLPAVRYTLNLPPDTSVHSFAVSPDGRYLAIAARANYHTQLRLRSMDSLQERPLSETDGAAYPFWSPDSRSIGFFAEGKLKKIGVDGEPAQIICDAPDGRGGTWNQEGTIVFAPAAVSTLSRVSAVGGTPVVVIKPSGLPQRFPFFLPDGRRFLYQVSGFPADADKIGIYLGSLTSPEVRKVVAVEATPRYVGPTAGTSVGHLLYVRQGVVTAQPVDPETLRIKGDPLALGEATVGFASGGYGQFSVSQNGILISFPGRYEFHPIQLAWFDRQGKQLATVGKRDVIFCFALSSDGKRLLTSRVAPSVTPSGLEGPDLWINDLEHGTDTRFTFDASPSGCPVWSPDGTRVVFSAPAKDLVGWELYQKASNGTGQEEPFRPWPGARNQVAKDYPSNWSRDGRFLIVSRLQDARSDLWVLPVSGDRRPMALLQSRFNEQGGQISPDGKWLAYMSDESGRFESYVMPFSPDVDSQPGQPVTGKWQISTSGGTDVRWGSDGKEVFYLSSDRELMVSEVHGSNGNFEWNAPQRVFQSRIKTARLYGGYDFQPSADGQRFLMGIDSQESDSPTPHTPASLTVAVNWQGVVRK